MSGVHDEMDGRKDVGSAVLRLDAPCLSWSGAMVNPPKLIVSSPDMAMPPDRDARRACRETAEAQQE
ncbi:hypothetical protein POSPLADRAFT_1054548 [Postia placenta MAD-698-R-SB12]|uniref:Uncharacterized protein n=1 Tax=Postia placenta MAD-698-R-SB12 TaxID=670580 RepID=A0A1X6N5I8_9APHY|nr:hypothetical protein POSPLADRAFT_1054548 [Postia placenta MAD-698-R-SB12]OSX63919.1 hypothetical protein POSPLADRAFT_1054548 [Postia placenta MAD-698-R-SB12]